MPDMIAASDRLEFAPPTPPGFGRALILALLAHLLLVAALTWGVHWKSQPVTLSAEAELWSAVPKEAAPQSVAAAPEPPPVPEPEKVTPPAPPPAPPPPRPEPEPPKVSEADIALEKEKLLLKKAEEKKLLQEKQRLEKLKREKLAEKLAEEKVLLEKKALDKKQAEKKLQDKRDQEKKLADEKHAEEKLEMKQKAQELERKAALEAKEEAKRMDAQRQANLKRMAGLAGATGSTTATGKDLQSSGPSSGYAGRIRARIKPNIVFTDDISTNPVTEVDVYTSPDGTIVSRKIVKSSGVFSWDEAVLRAIDKTETLPKDTNGLVPTPMRLVFKPKD
jgi:colicin import membrane protein